MEAGRVAVPSGLDFTLDLTLGHVDCIYKD